MHVLVMASNPMPEDLGMTMVWDKGAEAPRPRREDEATESGAEIDHPNLFLVMPAIGVS